MCYYNSITITHKELVVHKLRIRKVGNSLGTTLPKQVLQKLRVRGNTVFVTKTPDGVQITSHDPDFEKAMEAYRKVSTKYRNALGELAK